ncbi:Asp-tRNA(Asn)/Glu-tRNA(Gln) amidotransferase subunit GatC [Candidatus Persebacteraceae bacterium Df01]|jgi:aspartyl-tRNA(Asn)/glutamyl-tRNA(Gln) amidotransferase subunit C|uniref:Aspartyl/glutamyl-tRNA(Asn/Gln) amidotransferase subunit C n=1 Tax=Candidatus Doriopsillibacter californiensis TaxID=2970740 RepID=A0ABT7QLN5_9GAMM|nr:Asp-tRNA(Asn)/Glu-tRNA(Gln) amidotransferase subunit GatC [Candidatus Persebacteraceae bacterium Df01]
MSKINTEDLVRLARMTRLEVPPEKTPEALQALNAILDMMEQLQHANVDAVDALTHVQFQGQTLRLRDDTAQVGYNTDALFAGAPQTDDGCFIVPRVIE